MKTPRPDDTRCPACKDGALFDVTPKLASALNQKHVQCDRCRARWCHQFNRDPDALSTLQLLRTPADPTKGRESHPNAAWPSPPSPLPTSHQHLPRHSTMPAPHPTKTRLQPSSRPTSSSQQPSQTSPNVPTNTAPMTAKEFGRWRQALGLSQQRAGEKLGISRVSVGKIERGAVAVDVRTELACRWILATANWHIDVNERRSWMRALGRWTT